MCGSHCIYIGWYLTKETLYFLTGDSGKKLKQKKEKP